MNQNSSQMDNIKGILKIFYNFRQVTIKSAFYSHLSTATNNSARSVFGYTFNIDIDATVIPSLKVVPFKVLGDFSYLTKTNNFIDVEKFCSYRKDYFYDLYCAAQDLKKYYDLDRNLEVKFTADIIEAKIKIKDQFNTELLLQYSPKGFYFAKFNLVASGATNLTQLKMYPYYSVTLSFDDSETFSIVNWNLRFSSPNGTISIAMKDIDPNYISKSNREMKTIKALIEFVSFNGMNIDNLTYDDLNMIYTCIINKPLDVSPV